MKDDVFFEGFQRLQCWTCSPYEVGEKEGIMKRIFGEVRVGVREKQVFSSSCFKNLEEAKTTLADWYKKICQTDDVFSFARIFFNGVEMFFDPKKDVWVEI